MTIKQKNLIKFSVPCPEILHYDEDVVLISVLLLRRSPEWKTLTERQKDEVDLTTDNEGEFW